MKKVFNILILILALFGFSPQIVKANTINFVDDDGRQINLDKPCTKIISLYSAHTENLYTLGVGDKIIGVSDTSIYPADAAFKPVYDYNSDPEKIIAVSPDLVLIRPFITRKVPNLVKTLEKAGITVVSLYPEKFDDFDDYINKLGMLTGTENIAKNKLIEFHSNLNKISALTKNISDKQKIFFESTEVNLRTITNDSMPAKAIELAGGINIAKDVKPINSGSSIASFGAENILALADEIDVYVSQVGAMNAGGSLHSITIRSGFDTIKAVQNDKVYIINEKIISSPTFRFYKGVKELARYMYPELIDNLDTLKNDNKATKTDLANIIVKYNHLPIYITASSKYYKQNHKGHIYGMFKDVNFEDESFDNIETAVMHGYIDWKKESDKQFFEPNKFVTKEELAKAIYIIYDLKDNNKNIKINDLSQCENKNIVKALVNNNILGLNNGNFEPDRILTNSEIISVFNLINQQK